jgi:hypothetical protein
MGTACGVASPSPSASGPSASSPSASTPPFSVADASDLLFHCSEGPTFKADLFDGPATAELAASAAGGILRAFLASPDAMGYPFPQHGWWLAGPDADVMTFIARGPGAVGYLAVGFRETAGTWQMASYGACRASVVLPNGLGPASWMLDPNAPSLAATDTQFVAMVTEEACASGHSAEGRIAPPTILYEPERILVIIAVRPRSGIQSCQSNPQTRHVVRLNEPIGERRLLDGSFFPPHDPTQPIF